MPHIHAYKSLYAKVCACIYRMQLAARVVHNNLGVSRGIPPHENVPIQALWHCFSSEVINQYLYVQLQCYCRYFSHTVSYIDDRGMLRSVRGWLLKIYHTCRGGQPHRGCLYSFDNGVPYRWSSQSWEKKNSQQYKCPCFHEGIPIFKGKWGPRGLHSHDTGSYVTIT